MDAFHISQAATFQHQYLGTAFCPSLCFLNGWIWVSSCLMLVSSRWRPRILSLANKEQKPAVQWCVGNGRGCCFCDILTWQEIPDTTSSPSIIHNHCPIIFKQLGIISGKERAFMSWIDRTMQLQTSRMVYSVWIHWNTMAWALYNFNPDFAVTHHKISFWLWGEIGSLDMILTECARHVN